jgi:hypothetical protein
MGWRRILVNEAAASKVLFDESVALARRAQDEWILGFALRGLGAVLQRVDYDVAPPILEESLIHTRATGDRWLLGEVMRQLGTAALVLRDYARAAWLAEESLRLVREIGDREREAESLYTLSAALLGQGHSQRARGLCQEVIRLAESIGYSSLAYEPLILLGCIADVEDQPRRSAILLAAGESALNSIGTTIAMYPWHLREYEQSMASVQAQLGEAEFNRATAEGQSMTLEQAVRYALEEVPDG